MPAQKKPADKLQRRNKPKAVDAQIVALNNAAVPKPPAVRKKYKDQWAELWSSELAAIWNRDSDLIAMRRLFELYDRLDRYEREAGRESLVAGSKGQLRLNPLVAEADTLRNQILALEDRFGMTPMARLKLGIDLGKAQQSLQQTNARLAAGGYEDDEDELDPRVAIINTTAR